MNVFETRADRRRFLLAMAGVVVAFALVVVAVRRYLPFLTEGAAMREFVAGFGLLGPLVFVVLQAAQVVVAPVPGQVTGFVGGYLFGAFWGTVYSLLGLTIGSAVAFWLSRRFGRPFVERVVRDDVIARFDEFVARGDVVALFVVFLVPGPPDDAVCFLAGLTDIDIRTLVVVALVGRAPAYILVNVSGAGLAERNVALTVVTLLAVAALSIWGLLNRDALVEYLGTR